MSDENQKTFIDRWGTIIVRAGAGGGAFSYPAALDKYERALGLKPAISWLAKRLLTYDWDGKGYVWCSLKEISRQADVSYSQVLILRDSLVEKGYIREQARHGGNTDGKFDNRIEYDITGLLHALEYAIQCNPEEGYRKPEGDCYTMSDFFQYSDGVNKGQPFEPYRNFTTPEQVNEWRKRNHHTSWWGRGGGSGPKPPEESRRRKKHTCPSCNSQFLSASPNAKYCPFCRIERRKRSIQELANRRQ